MLTGIVFLPHLFSFITLPVEINAKKGACLYFRITDYETYPIKKALKSAALHTCGVELVGHLFIIFLVSGSRLILKKQKVYTFIWFYN